MWDKIHTLDNGKQYMSRGGIGKVVDIAYDEDGFLKTRILVTHNDAGTVVRWLLAMTIENDEVAATIAEALANATSIEWRGQWWPNSSAPADATIEELVTAHQCDSYLVHARPVQITSRPSRNLLHHLDAV